MVKYTKGNSGKKPTTTTKKQQPKEIGRKILINVYKI